MHGLELAKINVSTIIEVFVSIQYDDMKGDAKFRQEAQLMQRDREMLNVKWCIPV